MQLLDSREELNKVTAQKNCLKISQKTLEMHEKVLDLLKVSN